MYKEDSASKQLANRLSTGIMARAVGGSPRFVCFTIGIFCIILVVASKRFSNASLTETYYPSWQSVYSDTTTSDVIKLFDEDGLDWTLSSTDGAYQDIPASVPGDILSDLMAAGLIGDPYYDRNMWNQRRVWMGPYDGPLWNGTKRVLEQRSRTWEYKTLIPIAYLDNGKNYVLVVEGIKMGASITWNGLTVAPFNVTSQFLRYILPIDSNGSNPGPTTSSEHHTLTVTFDPSISTNGRFMACSGGWDWAPYAWEADGSGSRVLTFGIVNPIYLVPYEFMLITDLTTQIKYTGEYPRQPVLAGQGDFVVEVTIHLAWPSLSSCQARLQSDFSTVVVTLDVASGSREITANMTASNVALWWPNGLGAHPLYNVEVALLCDKQQVGPAIRRRIGFRVLALVTANDTDTGVLREMVLNDLEGSGTHGMFFRVNGAPIWARGANVVPMDQLEGRITGYAARRMVESASKANMNMLRVWGGGTVPPREFYEACDELGLLLYHDLMFVEEDSHGAVENPVVDSEIEHIVRKLGTHPSIVMWNGCNECGYSGASLDVYESFVMAKVARTDGTRPIWPSSPSSYGWERGVRMIDGLPNGRQLKIRTTPGHEIEDHGPYARGFSSSHPSVNGMDRPYCNETAIPTNFSRHLNNTFGTSAKNTFVSEFGTSVFSSFDSMSVTLPSAAWGLHGGKAGDECVVDQQPSVNVCNGTNTMAERNYAADNRIYAYFGFVDLEGVGESPFSLQLYRSMIAQVFWIKGKIDMFRVQNSFGALIWQLNENWPTGGWGTLEYGPKPGMTNQVAGGRWKPIMYVLRRTTFQDVTVACGAGGLCYAINDSLHPQTLTIWVEAWSLSADTALRKTKKTIELSSVRSIRFFDESSTFVDGTDVVLLASADGTPFDVYLPAAPANLPLLESRCYIKLSPTISKLRSIELEVNCDTLVLYIWLSTAAEGYFSDNGFHLRPGTTRNVQFYSLSQLNLVRFMKTFRILHLGTKDPQQPTIMWDAGFGSSTK